MIPLKCSVAELGWVAGWLVEMMIILGSLASDFGLFSDHDGHRGVARHMVQMRVWLFLQQQQQEHLLGRRLATFGLLSALGLVHTL